MSAGSDCSAAAAKAASKIICVQTSAGAWWWQAVIAGLTTVAGVAIGFAVVRWQVREEGRQSLEATEQSERQKTYKDFVAAVDLVYNRTHLMRSNVELMTWDDTITKILGIRPPRDQLDYDAAMSPTLELFVRAGVGLRAHASDAGWEAGLTLTNALQELSDAALAGATEITWVWGHLVRALRRWQGKPAPWAARLDAAELAYFEARRAFEATMRAEWHGPVAYRQVLAIQPPGLPAMSPTS